MAKNAAKVPVYKQNALKSKEAAIKKQAEDEAAKIIADAKARAQEIKETSTILDDNQTFLSGDGRALYPFATGSKITLSRL